MVLTNAGNYQYKLKRCSKNVVNNVNMPSLRAQ